MIGMELAKEYIAWTPEERDKFSNVQELARGIFARPDADAFIAQFAQKVHLSEADARRQLQDFSDGRHFEQRDEIETTLARLRSEIGFYQSIVAAPMGRGFWCEAVEQHFIALEWTKRMVAKANKVSAELRQSAAAKPEHLAAIEAFRPTLIELLEAMPTAETYAWAADPIRACWHASQSVPADATLNKAFCPASRSGWWYFGSAALPVRCSLHLDPETVALFWTWKADEFGLALHFAAFQKDHAFGQTDAPKIPIPSEAWRWSEGESLGALEARLKEERNRTFEGNAESTAIVRKEFGPDDYAPMALSLCRFFIAGCAWLRQRVVSETDGHIERHRRKQLMREHDLSAPPKVRVIELRRTAYDHMPRSEDSEPSAYQCRFVVSGHWRNQVCGPFNRERKLIYIDAFVKGPADKPLRVPEQKTVYAVRK